ANARPCTTRMHEAFNWCKLRLPGLNRAGALKGPSSTVTILSVGSCCEFAPLPASFLVNHKEREFMKQFVCAMLLGAIMFARCSFGQATDGNIVGTVLDASGAVVVGANVELANVDTGVKSATTTDASGSYRFGNVPVGTYTITVTATGFTTTSLKNVQVELSRTTTANFTVAVGTVSSVVEVNAAVALIDT